MKQLADPIYGFIRIPSTELKIIDTPEFQRLRRVSQLGLSSKVYPGATHSRFSHSIGVYHITSLLVDGLDYDYKKEAKIAGLMHDAGHGPYSHATECAFPSLSDHETFSCNLVRDFSDSGILPEDVDADVVCDLIHGDTDISPISGEIDADRIDYLLRDAHYTGVPHGKFDWRTIIQSAKIQEVNGINRICFDFRSKQAIESMLLSRKGMRKSVYKHPTSLVSERMLEKILKNTEFNKPPEELFRLDDVELFAQIEEHAEGAAKDVYNCLQRRKLYKTVVTYRDTLPNTVEDLLENADLHEIEKQVAQKAGVSEEYVICHEDVNNHPKSSLPDVFVELPSNDIRQITEISQIGEVIDEEGFSIQFVLFAPEKHVDKVRAAFTEIVN